jgi:hypothetical protein
VCLFPLDETGCYSLQLARHMVSVGQLVCVRDEQAPRGHLESRRFGTGLGALCQLVKHLGILYAWDRLVAAAARTGAASASAAVSIWQMPVARPELVELLADSRKRECIASCKYVDY